MSTKVENQLRRCFELLAKIRKDIRRESLIGRCFMATWIFVFARLLKEPERFSPLKDLGFQERRKKIEKRAAELATSAGNIDELLARTRLSGIMDSCYRLNESYREVIAAYLAL